MRDEMPHALKSLWQAAFLSLRQSNLNVSVLVDATYKECWRVGPCYKHCAPMARGAGETPALPQKLHQLGA